MPPLSPTSIKKLEEKLRTAVNASLSLSAAERPVYIGRHLIAALDGAAPPALPPLNLPARAAGGVAEELPQLEALLSNAVNAANESVDTTPPLKLVADFLLAAAAPPEQAAPAAQDEAIQPEALAARYYAFDALLESVASGAVAPLRGSFVLALHKQGGRLRRRQDLPPEAFWTAQELKDVIDKATAALGHGSDRNEAVGQLFCALSYRWLAKGEPDPDGFHLERVANFCKAFVGEKIGVKKLVSPLRSELYDKIGSSMGVSHSGRGAPIHTWWDGPLDCAIFWDFASIFQGADRTREQRELFTLGLRASNVWYGHAHAMTWMQPTLPEGFSALCEAEGRPCTSYEESGWCYVEASLSSLVKYKRHRIDIGMFTDKDKMFQHNVMDSIAQCSRGTRPPPLLPSRVAAELEHKSFFSRADVPTVAELYRTFFNAVAPVQQICDFSHFGWGSREGALLAEALPCFVRLTNLNVSNNRGISGEGAQQLAAAVLGSKTLEVLSGVQIKTLREDKLTSLDLDISHNTMNRLGPVEAIVLSELIKSSAALTSLDVRGNTTLGDEGIISIVRALRQRERDVMTSVGFGCCNIDPAGAKEVAEYLKGTAALKALDLSSNKIEDEGAIAIGESLKSNETLEVLELRYCNIGAGGGKALAAGLKEGAAAMTTLNMKGNKDLGDEAEKALREAVEEAADGPPRMAELAVGVHVRLQGLVKNGELNGKTGKLLQWAEDSGRWFAQIEGFEQHVHVGPKNVTPVRLPLQVEM